MKKTLRVIGFVLAIGFAASGCDESLQSLAGPSPNLEPTFASIQANIFESSDSSGRAACIGCHTNVGRSPAGGLNLTHDAAYAALVGVASTGKPGATRVIASDANNSYLVMKLEGAAGIAGQRMPRTGGPYLTDGQMTIIRRWITEGAANN